MKNTKILALLLIVVFAFSLTLGAVAAPNDTTIAVELKSSTATQVNVDLWIKNNPGFDNLQFYVYYDADVLKYNGFSNEGSIVPADKSWTPGGANSGYVVCTVLDMLENFGVKDPIKVSGDGLIVTLTFDVLEGATAETAITVVAKYACLTVDGKEANIPFSVAGNGVKVAIKNGAVVNPQAPTEPTVPPTEPTVPPTEPTVPPTQPTEPSQPTEPACKHEQTFDHVITAATCGADGLKNVICASCYAPVEKNVVIPATGDHIPETVIGKPATCTEDGLTTGLRCKVCKVEMKAQEKIPAAHKEVDVIGKAATCGSDGLSDGKQCSVCGEFTIAQKVIPATGAHSRVKINGKPATCGVAGLTDGEKCSVCDKVFVKQEVIPAINEHKYQIISTVESTCEVQGTVKSKCSICGDEKTVPLELKAHDEVEIAAVAPNCTETGLTAGSKCSVCGKILVAQTTVPATGHSYGAWTVSKEATCTAKGLEVRTCACGASEEREIPVKAHTVVVDAAVAATCNKPGLTEGSHCSVCNTVLIAQNEIAKTGEHKNNLVSENDEGKTYKCSVCGETSFVPHEENPPTTDTVVTFAIIALVLMSASAVVFFNGKKWTIG